jgi:hypothetical protein
LCPISWANTSNRSPVVIRTRERLNWVAEASPGNSTSTRSPPRVADARSRLLGPAKATITPAYWER